MTGGLVQEREPSPGGPESSGELELQVIQRRPAPVSSSAPPDAEPATLDSQTNEAPARKQRLTRIVAAAIASCTLILVAAGVARLTRSKPELGTAATGTAPPAAASPPAAPSPTPPATATTAAPVQPTTGNLVLVRPAVHGYVWLDGKKITATSTSVSCGPHQIKVGSFGHAHPISVPCGGDLKVWR